MKMSRTKIIEGRPGNARISTTSRREKNVCEERLITHSTMKWNRLQENAELRNREILHVVNIPRTIPPERFSRQ
jgi:hypothetical protein